MAMSATCLENVIFTTWKLAPLTFVMYNSIHCNAPIESHNACTVQRFQTQHLT